VSPALTYQDGMIILWDGLALSSWEQQYKWNRMSESLCDFFWCQ
jgi:hypothetical protein